MSKTKDVKTGNTWRRCTREEVIAICKSLLVNRGSVSKTHREVNCGSINPITKSVIADIKYKKSWVEVSDMYFEHGEFKICKLNKLTTKDVHLICATLVKYNGSSNIDTYSEVNRLSENHISYGVINMIKGKKSWVNISDKYFKHNQFRNNSTKLNYLKADDVRWLCKNMIRFNPSDIQLICETLVKYDGSIEKTYAELSDIYNNLEHYEILMVDNKLNQYRDHNRELFTTYCKPRTQLTKEDVRLICKTLVKYDGSVLETLDELKDTIIQITDHKITAIKNKHTWVKLSDTYFSKDTFIKYQR